MITLPQVLLPEHILLDLSAGTLVSAIAETAALLRRDSRVADWETFSRELQAQSPVRLADAGAFSICLPHARTAAVSELVMSAARLSVDLPSAGQFAPVRYIFCIGAPKALASDYLRLAGALMRIFSDSVLAADLTAAASRPVFLETLAAAELKL